MDKAEAPKGMDIGEVVVQQLHDEGLVTGQIRHMEPVRVSWSSYDIPFLGFLTMTMI